MLAKLKSPRVLLVGVVALVALFAVAYFTLFNTDSPEEFSLENQQGATNAAAPPAGELAGTWSVTNGWHEVSCGGAGGVLRLGTPNWRLAERAEAALHFALPGSIQFFVEKFEAP